jgi:hypothetical protein
VAFVAADPGTKTFLLGVGCQKGGTTWLQAYLAAAPECDPGFGLEYTIFDSLDVPEHTVVRGKIFERARTSLEAVETGTPTRPNDLLRLAMMADVGVYYDYFANLLRRPGISLSMDITPNYALLSERRLREIRSELGQRGARAAAVFVMRDPVERIWSQVRMHKQRGGRTNPTPDHVLVERRFATSTTELRTRYEATVQRLDDVFGDDVHYVFYERLFAETQLRSLCDFLGIGYRPTDVSRRLNASPKEAATLPDETVRQVAQHFRSTYAFVADRFGVSDLASLWPSSRFLE